MATQTKENGTQLTEKEIKELETKIPAFSQSCEELMESRVEHQKESFENGEYNYLAQEGDIMDESHIDLSEDMQEAVNLEVVTKKDLIEEAINHGHIEAYYCEQASPFQYGGPYENEFRVMNAPGIEEQLTKIDKKHELSEALKAKFPDFDSFENAVNWHVGQVDFLEEYYNLCFQGKAVHIHYNTDYDVIRFCATEEVLELYEEEIRRARAKPSVKYVFIDSFDKSVVGESNEKRELDYACNMGGDVYCKNCGEPWERSFIVEESKAESLDFKEFEAITLTQPSDDPDGDQFIQIADVAKCGCCQKK